MTISLQRFAAVMGILALIAFAFALYAIPSQAHVSPEGCNASAIQEIPTVSPVGNHYDGSELTYTVTYNNLDPDGGGATLPCDVTDADASITLPDGGIINVLTDAAFPLSTTITCPGGAGCAAGPYTYTIDHADETDGLVTADFAITGTLHQTSGDTLVASDDDQLSSAVVHPGTEASIEVDIAAIVIGDEVTLTITETNDGDEDLNDPYVDLDPFAMMLDENSANFSGDAGDPGVLDVGETWTWTVTDSPASTTEYVATGHGMSNGFDVTWCEDAQNPPENVICDQDERDTVTVTVNNPSTITTITSSASSVDVGGTVDLTITEENDGNAPLSNVSVTVDNGIGTLTSPPDSGDDGDGVLEVGETWSWTETSDPINTDTTFTATGTGTINGTTVTWCADTQEPPADTFCDQDEQDAVTVTVDENPSTIVTISVSDSEVAVGDTVTLTITEENDGDVDLTDASVELDDGTTTDTLDETHADFSSDGDNDSTLEVGETWTWTIEVTVDADTTYTATGHGMFDGDDITWCEDEQNPDEGVICDQDEQDEVSVTAEREVTWCSPGYWKNHPDEADEAAEAGGFTMDSTYSSQFEGATPPRKPKGIKDNAPTDPTLRQVLDNPSWYGGDAFNKVADLLSDAHPDLDFEEGDDRVENCPLN